LKGALPDWQGRAKIDDTGVANADAKAAGLGKMVLQMLSHQPGPAVIFVAYDKKHTVPVRLTNITIANGELTITVQPMEPPDRIAAAIHQEQALCFTDSISQPAASRPTPTGRMSSPTTSPTPKPSASSAIWPSSSSAAPN